MSNSSPSLQPLQQEQTNESDAVFEGSPSLNQETPNQPDPPPKSDPETISPAGPNPDPEENHPEEEEEDDDDEEEGEEVDEGQEQETPAISRGMSLHIDPPITGPHVSIPDVTPLTSPSGEATPRRGGASKRKKGKGKGKGKSNVKKQQAIEEKLQTLRKNLNPIPFIPHKILDFAKHEKLLRKLGLWDFVHIDFDRSIRVDLIAQLIANYQATPRASYVNGYRFLVNRADLARAFKLPFRREKGNVGGVEVDLDWDVLSDESISFIVEFVSDWVLLHEDMWMMPNEVMDWLKLIKDGHPEKVDWAGLLWFMVEKELKQGGQLRDCYYASHLQHLIKFQRKEVFLTEEPIADKVEVDVEVDVDAREEEDEVNEENVKVGGAVDSPREEDSIPDGPSTELTLGQDSEKEQGRKDVEMMDAEKCKDSDEEGGGEEQRQWLIDGKNNIGEHFIRRCGAENAEEFGSFEDRKEEEEEMNGEEDGGEDGEEDEEDAGNNFHVFPSEDALDGDGFTGTNLLQAMDGNHMAFTSQDQLRNPSSVDVRGDLQHIASTPSFFTSAGKRVIEHDNHISHHSVGDNNKRLRIHDSWDNKPVDFGMCVEQIQQMTERARMLYEEKEQALVQSSMNQQILLNELQKRDAAIDHLRTKLEETQKKDMEIYRLERELYLMGSVLDGYRKALKDVQKAFAEYKERAQLPEEPTYKDAGPGGLMLTAPELEKLRKKEEEDYKMNCLNIEQKMREVEEYFGGQFDESLDKINLLDMRLKGLEAEAEELIELYAKRKIPPTEENVAEASEPLPIPEPEENVAEASEPLPIPEPEEKVPEVSEPPPILEPKEKLPETAEPLPTPQTNDKVPEIAEPLPNE